jgi:hypothetical protein
MAYRSGGYRRLKELPKNAGFSGHFVENQVDMRTNSPRKMLILSIGVRM